MIKVIIKNKDDLISGVKINGHSGYEKHGKDIVCAAISSISQTAVMGIIQVLKIDLQYNIDEKTAYLEFDLPKNLNYEKLEKANIILKTMKIGILNIAQSYPKNIKVEEENEIN